MSPTHALAEPRLSVLVPTYGRPEALRQLLADLCTQSLAPEQFEVIAVDDGTPLPVDPGPGPWPFAFQLLRQANAGPGAARNRGLEHCRAPLVLILNDDARLAPDLLEQHLAAHARAPLRCAVLGSFQFDQAALQSPFVQLLDQSDLLFGFRSLRPRQLHNWNTFYTCNISLSKAILHKVGGFDAVNFPEAIMEDSELGYRLEQCGWRVLYEPACQAWHAHRLTPAQYFRRAVRLGVNQMRFVRKHKVYPQLFSVLAQGTSLPAFLNACQMLYEQHLPTSERLLASLERRVELGEPLSAKQRAELELLLSRLIKPQIARGILMEACGSDPEPIRSGGARAGTRTSLVVVSYNALEKTRRCLESLRAARDERFPQEIVVVDNGSKDGSAEWLAQQADLVLLANDDNRGAPAARNQALAKVGGDYIAFLDNDIVVAPGWLERLLYHAQIDARVGCVSPLTNRAAHSQEIPYDGDASYPSLCSFAARHAEANHRKGKYGSLFASFCVLVKRELLESIGGFDERFSPWGFEDDDFALRSLLAGFQNRLALDVFVRHDSYDDPAKAERHRELLLCNWERFARKWLRRPSGPVPAHGDYQALKSVFQRRWAPSALRIELGLGARSPLASKVA